MSATDTFIPEVNNMNLPIENDISPWTLDPWTLDKILHLQILLII